MPIKVDIQNLKFFNQLKNGTDFSSNTSDFTTNLVGNVGERVKAQFQARVGWYSTSELPASWDIITGQITRKTGSFFDDGFFVGGTFDFYDTWTSRLSDSPEYTAVIDFIATDGREIEFSVISGSQTTVGINITDAGIWGNPSDTQNLLNAVVFRFGLPENSEPVEFQSKVSGNTQEYFASSLSRTPALVQNLTRRGTYQDWASGKAEIQFVSSGVVKNADIWQIDHEFIILPHYLVGELSNLQSELPPNRLKGNLSYKYAFELEMRHSLADDATKKLGIPADKAGSTGWYNENFNGFTPDYEVTAVNYPGSNTALNLDSTQQISITVSKLSGAIASGTRIGLYFSYLPESETEYQDLATDIEENFILDSIFHTEGSAPGAGSSVFRTVDTAISSGDLIITADVEFTTAQRARLVNGSNYLLSVQIEDASLLAPSSDRVHLIADVNAISSDVTASGNNLINFTKFNLLTHPENIDVDPGATTVEQWNEDGILLDYEFELDTNKDAFLEELTFKLVADDGTNYFELQRFPVDLSGLVVSGGIQQANIDTTRGYLLNTGDQFNFVKLQNTGASGGLVTYEGEFGQKIKWQDWLNNPNADTVFYNSAEPQNNLNFKSSNYSGLNGYEIKLIAEAKITGTNANGQAISDTFTEKSGNITVFDYDESDDGEFISGTIQTIDPDSGTDLGGSLLSDRNTLFRITWDSSSDIDTADVDYIIHRIQPFFSSGDDIEESSSLRGALAGGILGATTFSKVGDDIVSESTIDYTKLKPGICYNLSGRISANTGITYEWTSFVCETEPTTTTPPPSPTENEAPNPDFCGSVIENDGGTGITELKLQANFSGYIVLKFEPATQSDKMELLLNGDQPSDRVATSHINNNSNNGEFGFDASTGVNTLGQDITLAPFQPDGTRYLAGNAIGAPLTTGSAENDAAPDWFVGAGRTSVADRRTEFIADTGLDNPFEDETFLGGQQLVWAQVAVGDELIIRVSGAQGTVWTYKSRCVVT